MTSSFSAGGSYVSEGKTHAISARESTTKACPMVVQMSDQKRPASPPFISPGALAVRKIS